MQVVCYGGIGAFGITQQKERFAMIHGTYVVSIFGDSLLGKSTAVNKLHDYQTLEPAYERNLPVIVVWDQAP